MKKVLFLLFGALLLSSVSAAPARPFVKKITTSDGKEVMVTMKGDEHFHWYETEDKVSYVRDENEAYVRVSGDFIAQQMKSSRRDLAEGVQPKVSKNMNIGSRKNILILVEYSNVHFQEREGGILAAFDSIMNGDNYKEGGNYGSVRQFFSDNSNGLFDFYSTVVGPIRLRSPRSYYGGNDRYGRDLRPRIMVRQALDSLHANGFDFSEYGVDGEVPNFHVIYAGYGEESGGPYEAVWAHKSQLWIDSVRYDGVLFNTYSCSPELYGDTGTAITNVGVICHELGHALGLPDFYDANYSENGLSKGPGDWSVMAGGSWNADGRYPPFFNAEERELIGWHTSIDLPDGTDTIIDLAPVDREMTSYRVNTKMPGEYFLFEVRQKKSWDSYLPGEGLLIYHADKSSAYANRWKNNSINNDSAHECFRLKSAVNSTIESVDGDAWPQPGKTEFTDESVPSAKSWGQQNTGMPITHITKLNQRVSFVVGDADHIVMHDLIVSAEANGTVSPDGITAVMEGTSPVIQITANPGFIVDMIFVNNVSFTPLPTAYYEYQFGRMEGDSTFHVTFRVDDRPVVYTISAKAKAGGRISPSGNIAVTEGESQLFTIKADEDYLIDTLWINSRSLLVGDTSYQYTFSNVLGDSSILATFKKISYTITASAGSGGQITPEGEVAVFIKESQVFDIAAGADYLIDTIFINDVPAIFPYAKTYRYEFSNVLGDSSIYVNFKDTVASSNMKRIAEDPVVMFPNPVSDYLSVKSVQDNIDKIEVWTMSGSLVFEYKLPYFTKEWNVDMRHFSNGFYIVKIYSGEKSFSRKIFKN